MAMVTDEVLTDEEKKAIASLHRLAKRWPKQRLWLFTEGYQLHVLRLLPDGSQAQQPDGAPDPAYIVDTINLLVGAGLF